MSVPDGRFKLHQAIEDDLTWRRTVALGCDTAQGFDIAPPLSTVELAQWRARR